MKKDWYVKKISDILSSMGLTVLRGSIDYQSAKPDMIAIYDNINKVYVIEVIDDEMFNNLTKGSGKVDNANCQYQTYLRDEVLYNLSSALKSVDSSELSKYELESKVIYAGIISPERYSNDIDRMLDYFDIEHKGLDIVDELHLQLISNEMTKKLKDYDSSSIEC